VVVLTTRKCAHDNPFPAQPYLRSVFAVGLPMMILIAGLLLFLGTHSIRILAEGWRAQLILDRGEQRYKGAYSLLALVGFVLIVYGYGLARQAPVVLFTPPTWTRHLAATLMLPVFVLLTAAYLPGTRIKRAVGHPMVLGVKLWALAHLLANGTFADLLLFGAFLLWAILDFIAARKRDRAAGRVYVTGPLSRDVVAIVVGLVIWVVFAFWLHAWLIGVRPFA